jgi:hypothetical protein
MVLEAVYVQSASDSTLVAPSGPVGPFTEIGKRFTFLGEQFWGRAARASNDSEESDARFLLLIFISLSRSCYV